MNTMISLWTLSDLSLVLSSPSNFNEALVNKSIFLESFNVFSSDVLILLKLSKQVFVLSLYLLQHLRLLYESI